MVTKYWCPYEYQKLKNSRKSSCALLCRDVYASAIKWKWPWNDFGPTMHRNRRPHTTWLKWEFECTERGAVTQRFNKTKQLWHFSEHFLAVSRIVWVLCSFLLNKKSYFWHELWHYDFSVCKTLVVDEKRWKSASKTVHSRYITWKTLGSLSIANYQGKIVLSKW